MNTFIIAEIAQAHEGSLGIAHSYIDVLAETGVDAVKFQMHLAHAESSEFEPFRVKFSYEDETRYDYWKRMEFTPEQWAELKKHCDEKGVEFLCSPFSNAAVDLLEKIGIKQYKIGSGEVSNYLMLEKIARTGKPIILSSGMSSLNELDATIEFLKPYGNKLSILHCTTAYPTQSGQWLLNHIPELKKRYKLPIGFSDHSSKIFPGIAAVALGAELLEFHVVFDKSMFGPDAKASLTIREVNQLVNAIRELENDLNTEYPEKPSAAISALKNIFEKSLAVNKNLKAGHLITVDDLEAKKPKGYGIDAKFYRNVVGREVNKDLAEFSFLNENDLV
jgi:N,N'-diacetyllegionaminate synthase